MNNPRNKSLSGGASAQSLLERLQQWGSANGEIYPGLQLIAAEAITALSQSEQRVNARAAELLVKEHEVDDLEQRIAALEAERDELQAQVNGMAENLSAATAELDQAQERCAQMKEELMWHRNKPLRDAVNAQEEREVRPK